MSWSTGSLLKKYHVDIVGDAGRIAAVMDLARRDIDADVEYSGLVYSYIDSRPITGGLRVVMKPAWDPDDGQATQRHNTFRDDIDVRRSLRLHQGQLPGHGTRNIVNGIGASYCLVRIENEIAAGITAEDQAKAGCNGLRHSKGRERDIERGQQHATKQYCPGAPEPALCRRVHVQGTIG